MCKARAFRCCRVIAGHFQILHIAEWIFIRQIHAVAVVDASAGVHGSVLHQVLVFAVMFWSFCVVSDNVCVLCRFNLANVVFAIAMSAVMLVWFQARLVITVK